MRSLVFVGLTLPFICSAQLIECHENVVGTECVQLGPQAHHPPHHQTSNQRTESNQAIGRLLRSFVDRDRNKELRDLELEQKRLEVELLRRQVEE